MAIPEGVASWPPGEVAVRATQTQPPQGRNGRAGARRTRLRRWRTMPTAPGAGGALRWATVMGRGAVASEW